MFYTYDPILVIVSVLVAVVGAYSCFDLVLQIRKRRLAGRKKLLIGAAFAIGSSIWAMHFIAMLAVNLPVEIRYDLLTTFVSGLVSVLMTAVALLIALSADYRFGRIAAAGGLMGLGIASMHYVGMSAIRGNCVIEYSPPWVVASVAVGIIASTASLWAAMNLHGIWRRVVAALVMGVSISGMHYTGMLGTTFLSVDNALSLSQPILDPFSLGLSTALASFVILGWAVLTLVPDVAPDQKSVTEVDATRDEIVKQDESVAPEEPAAVNKLPILKNHKTYFIDFNDVVHVAANGHYTTVHTLDQQELFCNYALSRVEKELDAALFVRVHRSHIVNLQHIESFQRQHDKGQVYMHGNQAPVPVSRSKISQLESVLGV